MSHGIALERGEPPAHGVLRGGAWLGLVIGTVTWCWVLFIDAMVGQPFETFRVLGGIVAFTLAHFGLNLAFGIVLTVVAAGSRETPSLVIGAIFSLILLEVAFAMITVLLGEAGLGSLSWVRIFAGSLLGLAVALWFLSRRYPLVARLREAEEER